MERRWAPLSIVEDREHNIWISTPSGLDRFSRSRVVRAAPGCRAGLGRALVTGGEGELWAACGALREVDESSLLQIRDGKIISERPAGRFTAAYQDDHGILWFGGPDQLASFDGHTFDFTPLPDELRGRDVQALAKDGSGALWVSVVRHGVYRLIETHKGKLWATANDGPGATFGFTIPCASGAATATAAMK